MLLNAACDCSLSYCLQITMLTQTLNIVRELDIHSSIEGGLREPWTLCFDKSRDRLYIGEWDGGRILAFDCRSGETTSGTT